MANVIENVTGAGGTTGTARAARASPDGYTIMMGHMGTHGAAPAMYPKAALRPDEGLEPVGLAAGTPILIVARKGFQPKDLKEFIAHLKANKDKVNQAHAGVGSVSHTTCVLLSSILGVKTTVVAYKGDGAGAKRPRRRPGRLHVRPGRQRHRAGPRRHDQGRHRH